MRIKLNHKAQSSTEWMLLVAVIMIVFIGMKTYIQRGLQARFRDGVQYTFTYLRTTTEKSVSELPSQFEPDYWTDSDMTTLSGERVTMGVPGRQGGANVFIRRADGLEADEVTEVYGRQEAHQ